MNFAMFLMNAYFEEYLRTAAPERFSEIFAKFT